MKIISVPNEKAHQWDDFLEHHPHATMYHLYGWKQVFESVFGYQPYYFMAVDQAEQPAGVLPMFRMGDIFRRKYLISNPFSSFAGICANSEQAESLLLNQAVEISKDLNARYVELRQLNAKINQSLPEKDSFVTLMLDLPDRAETVWQAISSRNRNKIRKAEKSGLCVDFGLNYLSEFYEIYAKNMKYLGTPVFPYAMFQKVAEVFKERSELMVLRHHEKTVSGMFLFKFQKMLSEPWVASLREYNKMYVNNYLYWRAIEYACENKFKVFDFGRSTVDSGTYRFKLQWGAQPVPLHYQYYLNKAKAIPIVDALNNKYQRIIDIWKKLPLFVTNFVGPRVVQYLPEL
ncbi:MAG: FemAB family XrtA/PEP-CTERM system-associated protein [bacterium]